MNRCLEKFHRVGVQTLAFGSRKTLPGNPPSGNDHFGHQERLDWLQLSPVDQRGTEGINKFPFLPHNHTRHGGVPHHEARDPTEVALLDLLRKKGPAHAQQVPQDSGRR